MYRIERIDSVDALAPWIEAWNHLSGDIPFRRWEWLGSWWQQFGQEHELFVLAVFDASGVPVGFAPWYREQSLTHGRVLRWLGSGAACSDYLSLLCAADKQMEVAHAVAEWLAAAGGQESHAGSHAGTWDLLKLEGVDETDSCLAALITWLSDHGHGVHRKPGPSCWRVPLPQSWEQYLASISKPNRRKVRWAEKQFQTADFSVRHVRTGADFAAAWTTFVDLHQRRRQSIGQDGCFHCQRFAQFLHSASEQFLASGRSSLLVVEKQGVPLAAELHLSSAQTLFAYQVGISPDHLADNPGWLVNTASLLAAHQAGQSGFDLLRGDEPYKTHLGAVPTPTVDVRIVSRRVAAQLRSGAWLAGSALRGWIKEGLELTGIRPRD